MTNKEKLLDVFSISLLLCMEAGGQVQATEAFTIPPPPSLAQPSMIMSCKYNKCKDLGVPLNDCIVRTSPYQEFAFYTKEKRVIGTITNREVENYQIIDIGPQKIIYGRRYDRGFRYDSLFGLVFERAYERYTLNLKTAEIIKVIYHHYYKRRGDIDVLDSTYKSNNIEYRGICKKSFWPNEPI